MTVLPFRTVLQYVARCWGLEGALSKQVGQAVVQSMSTSPGERSLPSDATEHLLDVFERCIYCAS